MDLEFPYDFEAIRRSLSQKYPLSNQQILFCYYYSKTTNGMASIRNAGYNHSTPGSQSSAAYRLLNNTRIVEAIEKFRNGEFNRAA